MSPPRTAIPFAHLLLLSLLLFAPTCGTPFRRPQSLPSLDRAATYSDIPSTNSLIYGVGSNCPDILTFGEHSVDTRQVALLPMSAIQEDGVPCTGSSSMAIVSEATVKQPDLLNSLGLSGFRTALDSNTIADSLVTAYDTNRLIGWHLASRTCGSNVYPPTTIYFIIQEDNPFTISFIKGQSQQNDTITIPPSLRSLLFVTTDGRVCMFVDPSTNPGVNPTIATTDADGNVVTATLVPEGSSTAPAPIDAASPPPPSPASAPPTAIAPPGASPSAGVAVTAPTVAPPSPSNTPIPSGSDGVVVVVPGDDTDMVPSEEAVPTEVVDPDGVTEGGAEGSVPTVVSVTPEPGSATNGGSEPDDDGSVCFPGNALVQMEDGSKKEMKELKVGDRVADGEDGFTDVVFFTHRETSSQNPFLKLITVSGRTLILSAGHYVFVNGGSLRAAKSLQIGEGLDLAENVSSPISFIENVSAVGLYNPQTASGSLVVNGFKVSAYTTTVHPTFAHSVLMPPVRWLYRISMPLAATLASAFDEGSPLLARLLPHGPAALVGW